MTTECRRTSLAVQPARSEPFLDRGLQIHRNLSVLIAVIAVEIVLAFAITSWAFSRSDLLWFVYFSWMLFHTIYLMICAFLCRDAAPGRFMAATIGSAVICLSYSAISPWIMLVVPLTPCFGIPVWVLLSVGGPLLLFTEICRRPRKRSNLCLKCNYPLQGLHSKKCPECGAMNWA